jgi:hypothetical protein
MKTGWFAFSLPGYREYPTLPTYGMFSYDELPPVGGLPDDFSWLKEEPTHEASLTGEALDRTKPDLPKLSKITADLSMPLPRAFMSLVSSPDLQSKVRS